jgi:plastocyanin
MTSRFALVPFAAAALTLLLCSTGSAAATPAKPVRHAVTIDSTLYQPQTITVAAGDSIVWTNKDPFPHTITSKTGGFDSKQIDAGKSWTFTARKKGSFPYVCTFHPTMTGTLKVR